MARIATAEVEVIADTSRFVRNLRRQLRQDFARMGDDVGNQLAERINRQLTSRLGRVNLNTNRISASFRDAISKGSNEGIASFNRQLRQVLIGRGVPIRFNGADAIRRLNEDLRRGLTGAGIPVRVEFDRDVFRGFGRRAGQAFSQGFGSTFSFGGGGGGGGGNFLGRLFLRSISSMVSGLRALAGQALNAFKAFDIGGDILEKFIERLTAAGRISSSTAQSIGQVVGAIEAAAGPAGAIAGIIVALFAATAGLGFFVAGLGAVIQLVQSLTGVIALLGAALNSIVVGALAAIPAGFTALGLAVGTAAIAFDGFFEAIKEGADSAAINSLSENAREAALEVIALKDAFSELSDVVSDNLFAGISDDIAALATNFMPALAEATADVATGLGDVLEGLVSGIGSAEFAEGLVAVGEALGSAFTGLAGPLQSAVEAFGTLAAVGAPVMERLVAAAGGLLSNFSAWVEQTEATGELSAIFDNMADTLSLITGSIGNIIEGFGNLFGFITDDSLTFLENIQGATQAFLEWTESSEAEEFMNFIAEEAMAFGTAIKDAIVAFVDWAASPEGQELMETLKDLAVEFATTLITVFVTFMEWAQSTEGQKQLSALVDSATALLIVIGGIFLAFSAVAAVLLAIRDFIVAIFDGLFNAESAADAFLFALELLINPVFAVTGGFEGWSAALDEANRRLAVALGLAQELSEFAGAQQGGRQGGVGGPNTPFRLGGIVRSPTRAILGEDSLPEVVIPLTRPGRAMDLMAQSGLLDLVLGRGGVGTVSAGGAGGAGRGRPIEMHVHSQSVNADLVAHRAVRLLSRSVVVR